MPAYNFPSVSIAGDKLQVYNSYKYKDALKQIGCRWSPEEKAWWIAATPENFRKLTLAVPGLRVDKEVTRRMTEMAIAEAEQQDTDWSSVKPLEPMPLKTVPFQHQVAAFNMAITRPCFAALMEQGCGKTAVAIAVAGYRFKRGEVNRVLVVAPASVVPVWPKEFATHADFPHEVIALEGPVNKRKGALLYWKPNEGKLQVAVTNYEATWRMEETLINWQPDMIICDESQRIKTPGARQSKAMARLGTIARYRMILTGTPVSQGPLDFYSQYRFLDRNIFGTSYYAFRARYALMGGYGNRQVIGYQNLDDLVQKAHSVAFRCRKEDCLDLPEQVDQVMYCELEKDARRVYDQLVRESVAELSEENIVMAPNVLSRLLRLSQMTGGYLRVDEQTTLVSKAKMGLLEETLDDLIEAGKKVVVFARFIPEIEAIVKMLEKKKVAHGLIYGATPMDARGEMVESFQTDPAVKVFVAQIQTAGLGITLHAADTAIFYSLDYSYANYDQCRARIHRIGQKNNCTYIHLVARNTVDEKVLSALAQKRDLADQVVDNWRELLK
jgi:SNF2 family DNA or RNA helicase